MEGSLPEAPETGPAKGGTGVPHAAIEIPRRQKMEVLGAILLALLLGALDQTIVGTALPRIITDLNGNDYYTWVVTIYLLTSTISVPFYGKLSDYFGRKPLLIFGIVMFLVGSALSGLSQDMPQLIAFRGLQGIGAGSLFPISLAVIGDLFTPAERGKYQGLFGAVFGLSALIGPFLGGVITDNFGWHWIFYINIPVGLVSLVVIMRVLPAIKRPKHALNLDWLGAIVFVAGMVPFLVGLTNKQSADWGAFEVGGLLAIGLVLLAVFLVIETRAKEPIVPLGLWRDRTYAGTITATFFASFGFFAATIFLPRFYQVVRGESATVSGWELIPLLVGVISSSVISGQIVARTGKYKVLLLGSLVLVAAGSLMFTNLTTATDIWVIRLWQLVLGLGIGPTLAVFTIVIQNAVPFDKLGVATSNLTFFRQIGGTVGLSMTGSYFGSQLVEKIPAQFIADQIPQKLLAAGVSPADLAKLQGLKVDGNQLAGVGINIVDLFSDLLTRTLGPKAAVVAPDAAKAFYEAMTLSIGSIFWFSVATAIAAFVAVLAIRELPLRTSLGPVRGGHGAAPKPVQPARPVQPVQPVQPAPPEREG